MPRLGVLGWPVAHSRSPAMHRAAFASLALKEWSYQRLPVPPELFPETTRALGAAGFAGANVTIPHKEVALVLADRASATAREVGAANTLSFAPDGTIGAENTDAPGLLAAMTGSPKGQSAMVLGAGGSARAVVWALVNAGARDVALWNRTGERAQRLAHEFGARPVDSPVSADLLINCTSVGLQPSASDAVGELNQMGLTLDQVGKYSYVVDLVYRETPTPLLAAAAKCGLQTLDGLEILVAQGALSFELWTGRAAPIEVMRDAARAG
jgi:shikimate dehydrogenase